MRCSHRGELWPLPGPHAAYGRRIVGPAGPTRRRSAGTGPGPRSLSPCGSGAPRPRWAHSAHTLSGVRACSGAAPAVAAASRPPPLFAHSASPVAPLRCAGPLRRGPPGPRFAAPVRRLAPALASLGCRGRAPRRGPPAPPLGPCAPLRGSAGARWPRCAWGRPPLRCGLPVRSPFLRSGLPAALRVAPPGPPRRVRFAASGPVASAPGACAALRAACSGLRPPGLLCSRGLPRCAITSGGGCQDQASGPCGAVLDRPRLRRCGVDKPPQGGLSPPCRAAIFSKVEVIL